MCAFTEKIVQTPATVSSQSGCCAANKLETDSSDTRVQTKVSAIKTS